MAAHTSRGRGTLSRILRIVDVLSLAGAWCSCAALIMLLATVLRDVIGRQFFDAPARGALETVTYWWMPLVIVLGFAYSERCEDHVRVTIVLDALPRVPRRLVDVTVAFIVVIVMAYLTYWVLNDARGAVELKQDVGAAVPVSVWQVKVALVFAMGFFTLQSIATLCRRILRESAVATQDPALEGASHDATA